MEDWHIVALVMMIVVFILVLALYVFLWQRASFVGQRQCSPMLLHYFLPSGEPRVLDLHTLSVPLKESIIGALLADCGLSSAEELSFLRTDEQLGALIVLDQDDFFSTEERPRNVASTATFPLILKRSAELRALPGGATAAAKYVPLRSDPYDVVPQPHLFPTETLISVGTPVVIAAVAYVRVSDSGDLFTLETKATRGITPIPAQWHQALEEKYDTHRRAIAVAKASHASAASLAGDDAAAPAPIPNDEVQVLLDAQHAATLSVGSGLVVVRHATTPADGPRLMLLRRIEPPILRYACDNSGIDTWYMYTAPIQLPVGRWCIRVEASTLDRAVVHSAARVYTVQQGFGNVF